MKKYLHFLIAVLMILSNRNLNAAPFDTGMITLTQPNDVTFTGRIWGDEFFWWTETESGYRFVQSGDGWYYYAALDGSGEFTKTTYKVGIDSPPGYSYQLERTQARIDEINQLIEEFNEQIELNRQWYAQKQEEAQGLAVTLKVGIILIEFSDTSHYRNSQINRPDGYLTADFDSMMFSYNYWYDLTVPTPHPENELVFGSFRDYWDQMSRGKLKITGKVVNPTDENGVPVWLKASGTRMHYFDYNGVGGHILAPEAYDSALANGYISEDPGDSNYYDKYAVVYALEAISGRSTVGGFQDGNIFYLAERSGPNLFGGDLSDKSFTHIGVYLHEFGHNIGFYDEYASRSDGQTDIFNFCLMTWGIYNGPDRKSACPATLSPLNRIERGWISSVPLTQDTSDFIVQYSYTNPFVYRIDPADATGDEHYLIESKGREGFDLYIPDNPADSVNQPGRLLIWHADVHRIRSRDSTTFIDHMILKAADNISDDSTQLTDFFPSTFSPNFQDFNDITIPAATLGYIANDTLNYIDNERPAHFTLNGIQKLANGNTLIDEIILHQVINTNSGGWQSVSVPFRLNDYTIPAVFPTAYPNSVFKYNGLIYVQVNMLENGPGYLAKFPSEPQSLTFQGSLIERIEIPVHQGWNITGSVSYSIPVSNINTVPPGIITGTILQFDGVYIPVNDFIQPGIGYWVKTTSAGVLVLDKQAQPNEMKEIKFDEMDKFIITDADGFSQTLFVANTDIDTVMAGMNIDLPPFFPELDFDSRFEYNEYVKKVSADSGTIDLNILVHTNSFPINLTWELNPENGIDYSFINDSGTGKISSTLNETGNRAFTKLDDNRIRLFAKASKIDGSTNLPTSYALHQNYPNPFNPSTTIKYDLPNTSDVSLIIYDILGRRVKQLVNEKQQAGRYEVKFDASKLASGVYIYQIIAEKFISSKKMILLR